MVTNDSEIYQRLVWWTQHPDRQKRELGLRTFHEAGLNGRMHPLAAAWVNAVFEASIERAERHREECFRAIDILNQSGMIEPLDFRARGIAPSFFKLTAAWCGLPVPGDLCRLLGRDQRWRVVAASVQGLARPGRVR